jgi:hypothetical protein
MSCRQSRRAPRGPSGRPRRDGVLPPVRRAAATASGPIVCSAAATASSAAWSRSSTNGFDMTAGKVPAVERGGEDAERLVAVVRLQDRQRDRDRCRTGGIVTHGEGSSHRPSSHASGGDCVAVAPGKDCEHLQRSVRDDVAGPAVREIQRGVEIFSRCPIVACDQCGPTREVRERDRTRSSDPALLGTDTGRAEIGRIEVRGRRRGSSARRSRPRAPRTRCCAG